MKELYNEFLETIPSLEEKAVAITGTTSGTGFYIALSAVIKNAHKVFLLNRKSERAEDSLRKLKEEKEKRESLTELIPIECDLMSFDSVRKAAQQVNLQTSQGLDVLINNAGICSLPDKRTKDGFDIQIQVNHLSHVLLTHLLLPSLEKSANQKGEARIVQHSSMERFRAGSIKSKYFKISPEKGLGGDGIFACRARYQMTKLAATTFAMILHKKIDQTSLKGKLKSIVAEPGASETDLNVNLKKAHQENGSYGCGAKLLMGIVEVVKLGFMTFQSSADGAMTLIQAGFGSDVDGGDFFVPKYGSHGLPLKVISKAEKVLKGKEKKTMSVDNQEKIWKASEEALGIEFFSTLIE
eukprot:snap_masked-scaffold_10-processed-gene-7.16-mRNA-1 protein AED:0.01 eAED:0.04 QI:0/-1/0/1/-1/1/1/0/353